MYMTRVLLASQDCTEEVWADVKDYFREFVTSLVTAHEKRYNSSTSYIAMAGHLGLWHGSPVGGKVINYDQNPLDCMGKVDEIDVIVGENNEIVIRGYHHDGVHHMQLYIITDAAIEKLETKGLWDTPEGYQHIVSTRKPVKLPKKNNFY